MSYPEIDTHLLVRHLGTVEYAASWRAMQDFNRRRAPDTPDELWLLQHPPVYTLGRRCRTASFVTADGRAPDAIPVIASDRGGRMTYHGPGQVVAYVLLDLKRRGWGVRDLVCALEQTAIDLLADYGIGGARRAGAPGVYVEGRKIAALGLRVQGAGCYHGLSLNVDMDLTPFRWIDPCGFPGLEVTQLADLGARADCEIVADRLAARLRDGLGTIGADMQASPVPGTPDPVHRLAVE